MPGYPLFLKLEGRHCVVYGGGQVATRKIEALLRRGARVTCVSREFSKTLRNLARKDRSCLKLKFAETEKSALSFDKATLVIAATSDRKFNARVAQACQKKRVWVNVVDDPAHCDFYAPAVVERGPLQIAISTNGTSPLFAKRLREEFEKIIPLSTGKFLEKLGRMRRKMLKESAGIHP